MHARRTLRLSPAHRLIPELWQPCKMQQHGSQVWLTWSPLSETCQRTLHMVPLELFSSATLHVLEWAVQANQNRQQIVGLTILPYQGNCLIWAPSELWAAQDMYCLLLHFARLCLKVDLEKNSLESCQSTTFICVALNPITMRACPSLQHMDDILCPLPLF